MFRPVVYTSEYFHEFFHSESLDYLVAFLAKFALILTEIGWFSFLYWHHSSDVKS